MNTTLEHLALELEEQQLLVSTFNPSKCSITFTGASCDSRATKEDYLFICKGSTFKPEYLSDALSHGARAYVCDESHAENLLRINPDTPRLVVSDIRKAQALTARLCFGCPDLYLQCIGITGTKGKTTTSFMLESIFSEANPLKPPALIGSITTYDGIQTIESANTTPEPPILFSHLVNARSTDTNPVILEVSSQALKYKRVDGLKFDTALFLNISPDHISPVEHPDFEDYFTSKLALLQQARYAIINRDTPYFDRILDAAKQCAKVITFSATNDEADVYATNIASSEGTVSFTLNAPGLTLPITLSLIGIMNVENALAATACALLDNVNPEAIVKGLSKTQVPGRMELVPLPHSHSFGLVDYAHNLLSFEKLFETLKKDFPKHKIMSVFGAPGHKAFNRRTELPQVACVYCDYVVLTEEDPGHESVRDICSEMFEHIAPGTKCALVFNRDEAVLHAVQYAMKSSEPWIICLLGKGRETFMHRAVDEVCLSDNERLDEAILRYCS